MFTSIILFSFIEARWEQSVSEVHRKIAFSPYKLVIILKAQFLCTLTMVKICHSSPDVDFCFCLLLVYGYGAVYFWSMQVAFHATKKHHILKSLILQQKHKI